MEFNKFPSHNLTNQFSRNRRKTRVPPRTVDVRPATGLNDAAPVVVEGRAALRLLGKAEWASDGTGLEKVDTKVGTTQLFGLPEA